MLISFIIVNYQSYSDLINCLNSAKRFLKPIANYEFIIVNNESQFLKIIPRFPFTVKVFQNSANNGFGVACNLGARQAQGDFLFFLNPDTEFTDKKVWEMLYKIKTTPHLGIIGPRIIEAKRNAPQPWTSGKKISLSSIIFRNTFNKSWNKKTPVEVDWVSGTALMIQKSLFEKLAGFDEKFWMYFEDQDLCLRAKNLGLKVLFYPHCTILHHNGKSWSDGKSQKIAYYQSQKYFFQKHHGKISQLFLKLLHKIIL